MGYNFYFNLKVIILLFIYYLFFWKNFWTQQKFMVLYKITF